MSISIGPLLAVCILSSGCGIIMIGPSAEKIDLTGQDEAQKNLEAVRAVQADQPPRSSEAAMTSRPDASPLSSPAKELRSNINSSQSSNPGR